MNVLGIRKACVLSKDLSVDSELLLVTISFKTERNFANVPQMKVKGILLQREQGYSGQHV